MLRTLLLPPKYRKALKGLLLPPPPEYSKGLVLPAPWGWKGF